MCAFLPSSGGVKLVLAHCASDGDDVDLDHSKTQRVKSFELFARMMDESRYHKLLYANICFREIG